MLSKEQLKQIFIDQKKSILKKTTWNRKGNSNRNK